MTLQYRSSFALCGALLLVLAETRVLAANTLKPPASPTVVQFPPVSELPSLPELPDPLVRLDGRWVTNREQWFNERRPELIALFQHYMYGTLPPRPGKVSGKLEREDLLAFGGKATLKEVTVTFRPPDSLPIHLMLVVPNHRQRPSPVILSMNYTMSITQLHYS